MVDREGVYDNVRARRREAVPTSVHEGPYFIGDGDICFLCGNCDFVLARNVGEQIRSINFTDGLGLVLQCPGVRFNESGLTLGEAGGLINNQCK